MGEMKWVIGIAAIIAAVAAGVLFFAIPEKEEDIAIVREERVLHQEDLKHMIEIKEEVQVTLMTKQNMKNLDQINYDVLTCNQLRSERMSSIVKDNVSNYFNLVSSFPFEIWWTIGEKPTGGYSLEVIDVRIDKEKKEIYIYSLLNSPNPEDMVTQAFTYPNIGIKINDELDKGIWKALIFIVDEENEFDVPEEAKIVLEIFEVK